MSEALLELQKIGAQKINEATHIPIQHIKAILESNFSSLSKIQFGGFISILEREYKLDLSEMKASAKVIFDEQKSKNLEAGLFSAPKEKNNQKLILGVIVTLILLFVLIYKISNSDTPVESTLVDNSVIESVIQEINSSENEKSEDNVTLVISQEVEKVQKEELLEEVVESREEEVVENSFVIKPKSKVWFGYIDADTHRHYQKTFSDAFELDPNKRWLLLFGHGYIDMSVNGEVQKFSRSKLRFYYHNGELKPVTLEEFKKLNRGRKW